MENAPRFLRQGKELAPAGGLVVSPADRNSRVVAEQESTNRAVSDEQHVTLNVSRQDDFHLADNARLRIYCPLPAPDARCGLSKELIGDSFELGGWKIARRRSIILMHGLADFQRYAQRGGDGLCRLDGFFLSTRNDLGGRCKEGGAGEAQGAGVPYIAQAPKRHGSCRINFYLGVGEIANVTIH